MAKVKGRWIFNTVLNDAGTEGGVVSGQTVSFTSNGGVFDRIIPVAGYQSVMTYSNIEYSYSVYSHSAGWTNEAFKVIDFDATEQEVTDEFYAWLTSNATQSGGSTETPEEGGGTVDPPEGGGETQTAKIKGVWVFNSVISGTANNIFTLEQDVIFTSNGGFFDRMIFGNNPVLTYEASTFNFSVQPYTDKWTDEKYKTVDFGDEELEVSAEFYALFIANAAPEENDSGGDTEPEPELPTVEYCLIKKSTLKGIADAVRSKTGKTAQILGSDIANEIKGIEKVEEWDGTVVIE